MSPSTATARVAVVVPCFDQAHHLGQALESLRAQGFDGWSAVVVDDGSAAPDEVAAVLGGLGDDRIRLERLDANQGRAAARNAGIRATDSELVLLLDANDRLAPDCLERLVAALDADSGRDCAFPDVNDFGRREGVRRSVAPSQGLPVVDDEVPPSSGTLMRRAFLDRVGLFDEAPELAPVREDFEFWLRAFQSGCKAQHVEAPLYERRVTYMSFYGWPDDDRVADYVLNKHRAAFDGAGLASRFQALWYARAAQAAYQKRDRKRAFDLSLKASRLDGSVIGKKDALQRLLPGSTKRALDGGAIRRAVPLAGYPMFGPSRHRPFFVIGLGHSGNELLRHMLTSHSKLHMPPPTWVLGSSYAKFKRLAKHVTWPDLVAVIMAEFAFHPEFRHLELDVAPLARSLAHVPKGERNLAKLIDAVYRHHAHVHGQDCERWGDDAPLNSLDDATAKGDLPKKIGEGVPQTLERLREVFPDARFLHLCRDGVEVVSNYLRDGVFGDVEAGAGRWLNVELQTTRFVGNHADACLGVRYEQLVAEPEATARGICDFLGLEFEPAMLTKEGAPAEDPYDGKARKLLSSEQKQALQGLMGDALAERGYAPATD